MHAVAALVVVVATSIGAHNRSEGRSSFVIQEAGRVDVLIELNGLDVPDICNADLLVEEARKPMMRERFAACLTTTLPQLLRLKADDKPCRVAYDRFDEIPAPPNADTVRIFAGADCGGAAHELPSKIVVDWGLFAGNALDHVSVAKIEQPHDKPKLAMLSKRAPRLTIEVARPLWLTVVPIAAGAVVVVAAVVVAAIVVRRRRARRRSSAE